MFFFSIFKKSWRKMRHSHMSLKITSLLQRWFPTYWCFSWTHCLNTSKSPRHRPVDYIQNFKKCLIVLIFKFHGTSQSWLPKCTRLLCTQTGNFLSYSNNLDCVVSAPNKHKILSAYYCHFHEHAILLAKFKSYAEVFLFLLLTINRKN